jgi:hypothetical protein
VLSYVINATYKHNGWQQSNCILIVDSYLRAASFTGEYVRDLCIYVNEQETKLWKLFLLKDDNM